MWDKIIGHLEITNRLRRALRAGRVGHAYLFLGQRGVGKATVARVFASSVLCGCSECEMCRRSHAGVHPDIIEIHPATQSFRISQIRDINNNAILAPQEAKRKVYILHNVEKLTLEAANSFLRTLEEPPEPVLFILLADGQDVLPTIMSRCQILRFGPLTYEQTIRVLKQSTKAEDKLLREAARMSLGSPGEAQHYLDPQMREKYQAMAELATSMAKLKAAERVQWIARLEAEKDSLESWVNFLALWMRDVLCYKLGLEAQAALPYGEALRRQADEQDLWAIVTKLRALQEIISGWSANTNRRLIIDQILLVRK